MPEIHGELITNQRASGEAKIAMRFWLCLFLFADVMDDQMSHKHALTSRARRWNKDLTDPAKLLFQLANYIVSPCKECMFAWLFCVQSPNMPLMQCACATQELHSGAVIQDHWHGDVMTSGSSEDFAPPFSSSCTSRVTCDVARI